MLTWRLPFLRGKRGLDAHAAPRYAEKRSVKELLALKDNGLGWNEIVARRPSRCLVEREDEFSRPFAAGQGG